MNIRSQRNSPKIIQYRDIKKIYVTESDNTVIDNAYETNIKFLEKGANNISKVKASDIDNIINVYESDIGVSKELFIYNNEKSIITQCDKNSFVHGAYIYTPKYNEISNKLDIVRNLITIDGIDPVAVTYVSFNICETTGNKYDIYDPLNNIDNDSEAIPTDIESFVSSIRMIFDGEYMIVLSAYRSHLVSSNDIINLLTSPNILGFSINGRYLAIDYDNTTVIMVDKSYIHNMDMNTFEYPKTFMGYRNSGLDYTEDIAQFHIETGGGDIKSRGFIGDSNKYIYLNKSKELFRVTLNISYDLHKGSLLGVNFTHSTESLGKVKDIAVLPNSRFFCYITTDNTCGMIKEDGLIKPGAFFNDELKRVDPISNDRFKLTGLTKEILIFTGEQIGWELDNNGNDLSSYDLSSIFISNIRINNSDRFKNKIIRTYIENKNSNSIFEFDMDTKTTQIKPDVRVDDGLNIPEELSNGGIIERIFDYNDTEFILVFRRLDKSMFFLKTSDNFVTYKTYNPRSIHINSSPDLKILNIFHTNDPELGDIICWIDGNSIQFELIDFKEELLSKSIEFTNPPNFYNTHLYEFGGDEGYDQRFLLSSSEMVVDYYLIGREITLNITKF